MCEENLTVCLLFIAGLTGYEAVIWIVIYFVMACCGVKYILAVIFFEYFHDIYSVFVGIRAIVYISNFFVYMFTYYLLVENSFPHFLYFVNKRKCEA